MSRDCTCRTSPTSGRSCSAASMALCEWYSAGQNLMYVSLSMKGPAPGVPPSGASVNGPVSNFMKPRSPSKMGAGPVNPSAAKRAANTPLRAALAKAQPFHMLSSPERVWRRATLHTPAIPRACVVRTASRPISLQAAAQAERVDEAPLRLVADRGGEILEAEPAAVLRQLLGQGREAHDSLSRKSVRAASPRRATAARSGRVCSHDTRKDAEREPRTRRLRL